MMDFSATRPRRRAGENIVPMINVVFLLLIFFLMSAQIAPPDPFDIELPQSEATATPEQHNTLYVSKTGELAFEKARGDGVWAAIAIRTRSDALIIRADAETSAASVASVLPKLAAAGVTDTHLITAER